MPEVSDIGMTFPELRALAALLEGLNRCADAALELGTEKIEVGAIDQDSPQGEEAPLPLWRGELRLTIDHQGLDVWAFFPHERGA